MPFKKKNELGLGIEIRNLHLDVLSSRCLLYNQVGMLIRQLDIHIYIYKYIYAHTHIMPWSMCGALVAKRRKCFREKGVINCI